MLAPMKITSCSFRLPLLFGLGLLGLLTAPAARAEEDVRFSATLTPEQRVSAGLNQLTVDNIAVIDGLVRQDLAASKFKDNAVDHTRFSQRRTARERDIAGLDRLTPPQLTQLDDLVGLRIDGPPPIPLARITSTSSNAVKPDLPTHKLDIHGEISFTYGTGKGGSFTGGDLVLTYDDPAGRYSVLVGYSEYQGKGVAPCFYPGYGYYRPYPGVIPVSR
jgi:hypothetical protein